MILLLATLACTQDGEITALKTELSTTEYICDAGMVAVGDRATCQVVLQSTGRAPVTVYDIHPEGEDETWVVLPSWTSEDSEACQPADSDGDGTDDALKISAGSKESPSTCVAEVSFRPAEAGTFRQTLIVQSNDNQVEEKTDEGLGVWRMVLRGIGAYPCGVAWPTFHDFGMHFPGGSYYRQSTVFNCGYVPLTIAAFAEDSPSFDVSSSVPVVVLPGGSESVDIRYTVPSPVTAQSTLIQFVSNDPTWDSDVTVMGNDCDNSVDASWDADEDGYTNGDYCSQGTDCDDSSTGYNNHPGADERIDGIDNDCDGETDEDTDHDLDADGDGYSEAEGDCDDANRDVNPEATESVNQLDDDCDGAIDEGSTWYDDDGDGLSEREGDCDDEEADVFPGADEVTENGEDDNCNTLVDEGSVGFDDDGDGQSDEDGDCDDADPWTFAGAAEDCDGRDNNCDEVIDEGPDGTPDGACGFVVERLAQSEEPTGCAHAPRGAGPWQLLALLPLASARRWRTSRPS